MLYLVSEELLWSEEEKILTREILELNKLNTILLDIKTSSEIGKLVIDTPSIVVVGKLRLDLGVEQASLGALNTETITEAWRTERVASLDMKREVSVDASVASWSISVGSALAWWLLSVRAVRVAVSRRFALLFGLWS
jgi:hypothetical protein